MTKKSTNAPAVKKPEPTPEADERIQQPTQLVVLPEVSAPVDYKPKYTRDQVNIIKSQIAKGASDDELKMFLYVSERTGLDPFTKQIHLVPRWDSKQGIEIRQPIVGIDGLRSVAERTNNYAGNTDPIFEGESEISYTDVQWVDKKKVEKKATMLVPTKATVTVKKVVHGIICDFTASAEWSEYYPGEKSGMMWRKMPKNMLGKCAEAKALRKAFPQIMSGLYVEEEMHQAQVIQPTEQQKALAQYNQAKTQLAKVTDPVKLEQLKKGISESEKYDDEQKKSLLQVIEDQIKKNPPAKPKEPDAPATPADESKAL